MMSEAILFATFDWPAMNSCLSVFCLSCVSFRRKEGRMAFDWPVVYVSVLSSVSLCCDQVTAALDSLLSAVGIFFFAVTMSVLVTFDSLVRGKYLSRLFCLTERSSSSISGGP